MRNVTNRKPLKVKVYRPSTVPKNIKGRFFDTRPRVWTSRRLCPKCRIRACMIPALVEYIISPTGICKHCICWEPHRHCCWCGVSHHGARPVSLYNAYIERLKELGCRYCEACHNFVSIPHALHPDVNPKPKVTNRKPEVNHARPPEPKHARAAAKPNHPVKRRR